MLLWISLALVVIFATMVCIFRDLIYAAISLAFASVALSVVLFLFQANMAAVFELSVCAGLITVLFVSTISLTKDSDQGAETRIPAYFAPFFLLLFVGLAFFMVSWVDSAFQSVGRVAPTTLPFRDVFWGTRATDVLGQVGLILAGVFGILAIIKRSTERRKPHE